jgi:hypothetical protein
VSTATTTRPGEVLRPPWAMSLLAWETYRSLGPLTYPDPENGWALAALVEAWTTVEGWLEEAARPAPGTGEVPWSKLLDPDRCPWWALRWCGQVYGLRLTPVLGPWERPDKQTVARWQEEIKQRVVWGRGRPAAIIAAAKQHTKAPEGDETVVLRERYDVARGAEVDAPGHLQVRVRKRYLIAGHDDQLRRDVRDAVPIGDIVDIVIADERDYDDVAAYYADYDAIESDGVSYATLQQYPANPN